MSAKGAFRVLNLPEGATPDEIKNAYRTTALKHHPDRHLDPQRREIATRYFLEVTEAYRTLVRTGHVKVRNTPMAKSRPDSPLPPRRAPPMAHKNSSESSISLDSFVHMVASSSESLTPPPSKRTSLRSTTWKQGIRQPDETASTHYRKSATQGYPNGLDVPQRAGVKGLAVNTTALSAESASNNNSGSSTSNSHHKFPISTPASPIVQYQYTPVPSTGTRNPPGDVEHPRRPPVPSARNQMPPYAIPFLSIGQGPSGEWAYIVSLSLEELFAGKHFRFGITRTYLSGKTKNVVIEIDIPAGCRAGTRIMCRNVGHESQPGGVFQDLAFVIEEVPHDRFVRVVDDLVMDVRLPWVDSLRRQGGKVPFVGLDGRQMCIHIDYPHDKVMKGRTILKGAGMPIRERGKVVGRGNMVVQWEILPPKIKIFLFFRRLFGRK